MPTYDANSANNNEKPVIRAPDNRLRKKMGTNVALSEVFTPERMQQCQQIVEQAQAQVLRELEPQLAQLGQLFMHATEDPAQQETCVKQGKAIAGIIRKRMQSFGFQFGLAVAKTLDNYLQSTTANHQDMMLVVCKHLAVLHIIVQENIQNDGGETGRELLANLQSLIEKTRK